MRDLELGRLVRALRRRRGWRQADCAVRARVHRSTWSNLERGRLDRMSLTTIRDCLAVLEIRLQLTPLWRGSQVDRLLDEGHASLAAAWKERLEGWGWLVRAEVSYSRYGERGRIDLLGWLLRLRLVVVIEIKTEIVDIQELLGSLDMKARVAPHVVRGLGWDQPALVVPVLIASDTSVNRARVRRAATLFSGLGTRGRLASSWLRHPGTVAPSGLLIFSDLRPANGGRLKSVGAHRIRSSGAERSVQTRSMGRVAPARGT